MAKSLTEMTDPTAIGPRTRGVMLTIARLGMGVSQGALARELGVDQSVVSRWEHAAYPTAAACQRYVEALKRLALEDEP